MKRRVTIAGRGCVTLQADPKVIEEGLARAKTLFAEFGKDCEKRFERFERNLIKRFAKEIAASLRVKPKRKK